MNNVATITSTSGLASQDGKVWIYNTILANNLGSNCAIDPFDLISGGGNLESGDDCDFNLANDQTNTNPLLGPLFTFDDHPPVYTLLPGSSAIDRGENSFCPSTDQRGSIRPNDGDGDNQNICDIGAYEYYFGDFANALLPLIIKP